MLWAFFDRKGGPLWSEERGPHMVAPSQRCQKPVDSSLVRSSLSGVSAPRRLLCRVGQHGPHRVALSLLEPRPKRRFVLMSSIGAARWMWWTHMEDLKTCMDFCCRWFMSFGAPRAGTQQGSKILGQLVLVMSGVTRRDGFPYSILNGGGVLDAKVSLTTATLVGVASHGLPCILWRLGLLGGKILNGTGQ